MHNHEHTQCEFKYIQKGYRVECCFCHPHDNCEIIVKKVIEGAKKAVRTYKKVFSSLKDL